MLPLGEHNHDQGTARKDKIEAAGDHRHRSNDRLVPEPLESLPQLAQEGAWRSQPFLLKGNLDQEQGASRDDIGERNFISSNRRCKATIT